MILNEQVPEHKVNNDSGQLDIVGIWATIQGEGPLAGRPAIFIRLAGCNLQCPLCDTDYTTSRGVTPCREIIKRVVELDKSKCGLVVLTGGEPFRQRMSGLVIGLRAHEYEIQIESNGTIYDPDFPYHLVSLVVSPKTPKIDERVARHVTAWKYVLRDTMIDKSDGLPINVLGYDRPPARPVGDAPIYVVPCDEKDKNTNDRNYTATARVSQRFNYRLSVQMQKIVGVK